MIIGSFGSRKRASSRRTLRIGLQLSAAILSGHVAIAQDVEPSPWFVRTGWTSAHIFAANPFQQPVGSTSTAPIEQGSDLTFEVGRQTDGTREWHHLYDLPAYGFGFSLASFHNDDAGARPLEAYAFFSWPFARIHERFDLTTDFGMGVSWHWKDVNQTTGLSRTTLGSDLNALIDWGFYLRYLSTPRTSLYIGLDYTHQSNGGIVQPDGGINVIGPKVGVRYSFGPEMPRRAVEPRPPFQPAWEFVIGGAGGSKSVMEKASPLLRQSFGAFDVTTAVQRHFYQYGKVAAGADVTYDGSTGAKLNPALNIPWRADGGQRWAVGPYAGYEHVIGRFGAIVQIGYVAVRGFDDTRVPRLYQRFGWRVHLTDPVWATVAIRAIEGSKANFLEFGVGYRVRWE